PCSSHRDGPLESRSASLQSPCWRNSLAAHGCSNVLADGCSMNPDWQARYELMTRAAREAGRIALSHYPDLKATEFAAQVIWKDDNSPVSVADREAETHIRKVLLGVFPDDGFLGEEYGDQLGQSGYRWIVDPIDGTR